jgi:hypothetical protein
VGRTSPIDVEVLRYDLFYIDRVKDELGGQIPALNPKRSTLNEGGKRLQETLNLDLGRLKPRWEIYQMAKGESKLDRVQNCRLRVAAA